MRLLSSAALVFALGFVSPARAEEATSSQAAAVAAAPAPVAPNVVAADTYVSIEIVEPIGTKTNKAGDTFTIRLAEPIRLGKEVLIPAGVSGKGQIVDSGRSGMGGKPAKLVLAARYLNWDGRTVPLKAFRWAQTGQDRDTEAMVLSMMPYVGILSVFVHGGEIEVPAGARALAKLAADVGPAPDTTAAAAVAPAPAATTSAVNPSTQPATQGAPL